MARTISRFIADDDLARASVARGPNNSFVFSVTVSEDDGDGVTARERSYTLTPAQIIALGGFTQAQVDNFRNSMNVLFTKMREGADLTP
jgi:hypothetical protein